MKPTLEFLNVPTRLKIYLLYPNRQAKFNTSLALMIGGWFISISCLAVFICEITGAENFGLNPSQLGACAITSLCFVFVILWGYNLYEEIAPIQKNCKNSKNPARITVL